jgi:glyoxylase-like metal-dependent hydrolase (beta-lactamase superfamily II)
MPLPRTVELPEGITCIDTGLFGPDMAACFLIQEGGKGGIVECGGSKSAHVILEAVRQEGIAPEDVLYVMPTHVHLDHGGGAGALMALLPNAKLVIHPRGKRHMQDPSKLWSSAADVYGEDTLLKDYGPPVPVPEERMIVAEDGLELDLNSRPLLFLDTPGHARHHYSVWDEKSRGFFTGDTFGVSYRQTDNERGAFIMPTTTPVQFDPGAWHLTLDRYLSFDPRRMYLTHYSMVEEVPRLTEDLRRDIDEYAAIAQLHREAEDRHRRIKKALVEHTLARLQRHGCALTREQQHTLIDMDMDLNTQGLCVWLDTFSGGRPSPAAVA